MKMCRGTQVIRGYSELAKFGAGSHWCERKHGHPGKHQCNGCNHRWIGKKTLQRSSRRKP